MSKEIHILNPNNESRRASISSAVIGRDHLPTSGGSSSIPKTRREQRETQRSCIQDSLYSLPGRVHTWRDRNFGYRLKEHKKDAQAVCDKTSVHKGWQKSVRDRVQQECHNRQRQIVAFYIIVFVHCSWYTKMTLQVLNMS